jgi:ketosteroid isomerase-like protein
VTYVTVREGRPAELPAAVREALGSVPPGGRGLDRVAAAELLSRLHKAQGAFYAEGADGPLRAVLDPAVSWYIPGRNAIAGKYHGLDAVLGYMAARRHLAHASLRLHPGELLVGGHDHVASLTDGSAVIDGTERRWSTVGLYRIRDGRIAECRLLPLDADEFDDIWRGPS